MTHVYLHHEKAAGHGDGVELYPGRTYFLPNEAPSTQAIDVVETKDSTQGSNIAVIETRGELSPRLGPYPPYLPLGSIIEISERGRSQLTHLATSNTLSRLIANDSHFSSQLHVFGYPSSTMASRAVIKLTDCYPPSMFVFEQSGRVKVERITQAELADPITHPSLLTAAPKYEKEGKEALAGKNSADCSPSNTARAVETLTKEDLAAVREKSKEACNRTLAKSYDSGWSYSKVVNPFYKAGNMRIERLRLEDEIEEERLRIRREVPDV